MVRWAGERFDHSWVKSSVVIFALDASDNRSGHYNIGVEIAASLLEGVNVSESSGDFILKGDGEVLVGLQ